MKAGLLQLGFSCTYLVAAFSEVEQGDAYIQQDRETGFVQEILVVQFQTMYIVV